MFNYKTEIRRNLDEFNTSVIFAAKSHVYFEIVKRKAISKQEEKNIEDYQKEFDILLKQKVEDLVETIKKILQNTHEQNLTL